MKKASLDKAKEEVAQAVEAVQALASEALSEEKLKRDKIESLFGQGGDTREQLDTIKSVILNLSDRVTALESKK